MSEKSIRTRLQLKAGRTLLIVDPPDGYVENLGEVPAGADVTAQLQPAFIVQVFIRSQIELSAAIERYAPLVLPGGMLWLTYPKLTSKMKSDIHRDSINDFAKLNGWIGNAIISIDADWSALRLKRI
ncbi:MAG TPA: hypothetical protein PK883_00885 [Anaerolineaceae bacterium]|nr:hypothetical protein [Anaerolineaceae bacterium]